MTRPAGIFGSGRRVSSSRTARPRSPAMRCRLVGGAIGEIGNLDLAGLEGHPHGCRRKENVGRDERADEHQQLARAPDAGSEGHGLQKRTTTGRCRSNTAPKNSSSPCRSGSVRRCPRSSTRSAGNRRMGRIRPQRRELGMRRQKRGDHLPRSLRARSSRWRRRAGRRRRRPSAAWSSMLRCAAANAGRRSASRRHLMSGSRRSVPRPEQGASTMTVENSARKGSGAVTSAWTSRTLGRRLRPPSAAAGPCAARGRRTRSAARRHRALPRWRSPCRRATRRYRARSGPGACPASSATSCDASSCTTNSPRPTSSRKIAAIDHDRVGRVAAGVGVDVSLRESVAAASSRAVRSRLARTRQLARAGC